ncbi:MAG: hypothetical protein ABH882_03720 [Candidatus Omnitrophota bacterium]|nr:hypothetical protein [Candidatus Omnitrophota bacterium]MBU1928994.1 hypothetical protein [Candidatus Omnitrophota bacterium]MBU2035691.1 hypothetical protein [Candidatus Omnitrophota bacterium]MBU2258534.1 hypothetical protein [Candidatus Omnitrophota bacterium]
MNGSRPQVKAMLVCDSVITEQGTNKNSLIGIFENINAKVFPCIHGKMGVYVNFTDTLGKYQFRLELINVEKNLIIGHAEVTPIEYQNKLGSYNLVFVLEGLRFDRSGKYEFRLYANGEICEVKTFNVTQTI